MDRWNVKTNQSVCVTRARVQTYRWRSFKHDIQHQPVFETSFVYHQTVVHAVDIKYACCHCRLFCETRHLWYLWQLYHHKSIESWLLCIVRAEIVSWDGDTTIHRPACPACAESADILISAKKLRPWMHLLSPKLLTYVLVFVESPSADSAENDPSMLIEGTSICRACVCSPVVKGMQYWSERGPQNEAAELPVPFTLLSCDGTGTGFCSKSHECHL
jgi:hypothetical protein